MHKELACGFHTHSHFSLDGASTIKQLVKRSVDIGRTHVCLTDHGNMNGLADLHMQCAKAGIKPIHGIEAYVINDAWMPLKFNKKTKKEESDYCHLTIHFLTERAYQWFCSKTPLMEERADIVFGERKPIIFWQELLEIAEELVLGSGCFGSFVMKTIRRGDIELAEKIFLEIKNSVPKGQFFAEIFPHQLTETWQKPLYEGKKIVKNGFYKANEADPECGHMPLDIQRVPNMVVMDFAQKHKVPIVFSADEHLHIKEVWPIQNIKMGRGKDSWRFSIPYSMEPAAHMCECMKAQMPDKVNDSLFEEMVDNSHMFASLFDNYKFLTAKDKLILPTVETIYGDFYGTSTNKDIAKQLIIKHGKLPTKNDKMYKVYMDRLAYEISVIADSGIDLLPYFFVLEDLVQWAKDNGHIVQARGSASGSLLVFLLGISAVDPIIWGLQFERFLNKARLKGGNLPDIDCITKNCKIRIQSGENIALHDLILQNNNLIKSYENGNLVDGSFIEILNRGKKKCYLYELEDGNYIECTENHRVLTNHGFLTIEEAYEKKLDVITV